MSASRKLLSWTLWSVICLTASSALADTTSYNLDIDGDGRGDACAGLPPGC